MRTTRTYFEEVCITAEKKGKCGCGVRRVRREKFWQTINPFNISKKTGFTKTREEIVPELRAKADKWRKQPITCAKCDKGATQ